MSMGTVVQLKPSQSELSTVRGGRRPNGAFRSREYLTEPEIEKLRKAARKNRNPVRDELLILLAFRHALRVSELVSLTVEQFDVKAATVHIRRAKNGTPGIHGLQGDELRLIRQLIRQNGEHSRFLFLSERKAPYRSTAPRSSLSGLARPLGCHSRSMPTCCGTRPGMPLQARR
jgi:integrase